VKTDKIYLVGFMGAGKSSVARRLAKRLGWRAIDIDSLIEQREHMTVADIFAKRGEPYFRAAERAVLVEQLGTRHVIVATGGGTFVDPHNRAMINQDGVSVWLDVPLDLAGGWTPAARCGSRGVRAAVPRTSRGVRARPYAPRSESGERRRARR